VAVGKGVGVADGVAVGGGARVGAAVGDSPEHPAIPKAIAANTATTKIDRRPVGLFLTPQYYV